MNFRKRQNEELVCNFSKRPRSNLPVYRNTTWDTLFQRAGTHKETKRCTGSQADQESEAEAIAALLEIGSRSATSQAHHPPCTQNKIAPTATPPPLPQPLAQVVTKVELQLDKLSSSSSGSDGSVNTAMNHVLGRKAPGRSFEKTLIPVPEGLIHKHRIVNEGTVKLAAVGPVEVQITGARTPKPNLLGRIAAHAAGSASGGSQSAARPIRASASATATSLVPAQAAMQGIISSSSANTQLQSQAESPAAARVTPLASSCGGQLIVIPSQASLPSVSAAQLPYPSLQQNTALPQHQHRPASAEQGPSKGAGQRPNDANHTGKHSPKLTTAVIMPKNSLRSIFIESKQLPIDREAADKPVWQNTSTASARAGSNPGASSGDESSDETWQPNWGLDLFSALNPSVITTGHCSFKDNSRPTRD